MRPYLRALSLLVLPALFFVACSDPPPALDADTPTDVAADLGDDHSPPDDSNDAGDLDVAAPDVPATDTPAVDVPTVDAPVVDAPMMDGPVIDAPPVDRPPACVPATCSGHGQCADVDAGSPCRCDTGWAGERCERCDEARGYRSDGRGGCTNDPCTPNPCAAPRQTVCTAVMGVARCGCDTGYHPDGVGGCTDDPCRPDPCAASMRACRNTAGRAECYTPMCDDRNPCTDDRFDGMRCVSTPRTDGVSCSTGLCRTGETCRAGACTGGGNVVCDDRNPCTRDRCDPAMGCVAPNDDTLVPDDGIACTVGRCAAGVATHTPSNAVCDDGRWCTGAEACAPGAAGADARGCTRSGVPSAPGPDTQCRRYRCDDASRSFVMEGSAPGTRCDDGFACTTSDACDAAGACIGTATATCAPPTGSCSSLVRLPTTIDVPAGTVSGRFTMNGAALPTTSRNASSFIYYLRATDTGALHEIGRVSYSGSYPNYTRGADTYTTLVPGGVYDVLMRRAYDASTRIVSSPEPTDTTPGIYRVLQTGVTVSGSAQALGVDFGAASIAGNVTMNGAALPATSRNASSFIFYLRARDTGALHEIARVSYSGSYPNYTRGADTWRTLVPTGAYDILARRSYDASTQIVSSPESTDTTPGIYRFVGTCDEVR